MKLTYKSIIYNTSGFVFGLVLFVLTLKFYDASNTRKFIVSFIVLFIPIIIFNRISNNIIKKHIETSPNPRREYWRLFLKNQIENRQLHNIPDPTDLIKKFDSEYYFFDKDNPRKIRFFINECGVRFQNIFGKFTSYRFYDIDKICIQHRILSEADSPDVPVINIILKLNNQQTDVCDIKKINCNIDELEQIIENFAKDKFRKTATGADVYTKKAQ